MVALQLKVNRFADSVQTLQIRGHDPASSTELHDVARLTGAEDHAGTQTHEEYLAFSRSRVVYVTKMGVHHGEAVIFLKADKVFAQPLCGGVCVGIVPLAGEID